MREITKIMKGWEFTGPDGTTTTVETSKKTFQVTKLMKSKLN